MLFWLTQSVLSWEFIDVEEADVLISFPLGLVDMLK
jgi:hypothetical protein